MSFFEYLVWSWTGFAPRGRHLFDLTWVMVISIIAACTGIGHVSKFAWRLVVDAQKSTPPRKQSLRQTKDQIVLAWGANEALRVRIYPGENNISRWQYLDRLEKNLRRMQELYPSIDLWLELADQTGEDFWFNKKDWGSLLKNEVFLNRLDQRGLLPETVKQFDAEDLLHLEHPDELIMHPIDFAAHIS